MQKEPYTKVLEQDLLWNGNERKKRHSRPSGSIVITGFGATTGFLPEFEEPEFELAADRFVESDFCISMYASGRYPH